jgi:RNA polymerase primary sigma factor
MPEADATEVKSGTALTIFMKQMGRYPLLTADEEKRLAQIIYRYQTELKKKELKEKLQRGMDLSDEERQFLKTHSPLTVDEELLETLEPEAKQAIDRFITANLRLVVSIAKHYASNLIPLEDLIEEGVLGLMKAIEDFNPTLGYKFSTYATWWIRQHVERYVANTKSQVRVPVHMQESIRKYEKTYEKLLATLGRPPSDEEIAQHMGLALGKVQNIRQTMKYQYVYIDSAPDSTPYEVPDRHPWASPEEYVMRKDMERHIFDILNKLPERNRDILMMYFGIGEYSPMSLAEIGQIYGLSRERVRQIINSSLKKLRYRAYLQKLKKVAPFYSHVSSPSPQHHITMRYKPVFKRENHPVYTEVHRPIRPRKYFLLNSASEETSHYPKDKKATPYQAHTSTTFKIVIPTRRIRQSIFHILKKLGGQ